jgi:hypothetical protein
VLFSNAGLFHYVVTQRFCGLLLLENPNNHSAELLMLQLLSTNIKQTGKYILFQLLACLKVDYQFIEYMSIPKQDLCHLFINVFLV